MIRLPHVVSRSTKHTECHRQKDFKAESERSRLGSGLIKLRHKMHRNCMVNGHAVVKFDGATCDISNWCKVKRSEVKVTRWRSWG